MAFDFIDGGADAETTLRDNEAAFERIRLRPRTLVDVSTRDSSTTVFGERWALPLAIAPTGMSRIAARGGDLAGARAAARAGAAFALSTMSSHSIEEVAAAAPEAPLWFQLYLWRDPEIAPRLVERARRAGYRALVLTTDVPVIGNRLRDRRNGFVFPPKLRPATAVDLLRHPRWLAQAPSAMNFANAEIDTRNPIAHAALVQKLLGCDTASWERLAELREQWDGQLIVKGVITVEDALRAADAGADGIVVSNHGGRQLDGLPATVDALPAIAAAVGERLTVMLDGGVRRGSDLVKARALGARACLIGRPWLYGLAADGEGGVEAALGLLAAELDRTLALLGVPSFDDVDASVLDASPAAPTPRTDGSAGA
ncbi:MAG: alpha-hydroxy-acid oxidizing protein [Actinobacteria bacterium]|nr:alpha-hydroxy-acid oxidizing protein [Actinomycetota bacterium]